MYFILWLITLLVPAPVRPADGLLIGVKDERGYYTLIRAAEPHAPMSRVPGLVVPRNGDLWRFDVALTCFVQTGSEYLDSAMFINRIQVVTRQRIGSDSLMVLDYDGFRPRRDDELGDCAGITLDEEDSECIIHDVDITYLSSRHLSLATYHTRTEFCSPDKYYYLEGRSVLSHDGEPQKLLPHLPPDRAAALLEEWRATSDGCVPSEEPDEWSIARGNGKWEARLLISDGRMCIDSDSMEMVYAEPLPAEFASDLKVPDLNLESAAALVMTERATAADIERIRRLR